MLKDVYDRSGYDYFIDYRGRSVTPLCEADLGWIDACYVKRSCAELRPIDLLVYGASSWSTQPT